MSDGFRKPSDTAGEGHYWNVSLNFNPFNTIYQASKVLKALGWDTPLLLTWNILFFLPHQIPGFYLFSKTQFQFLQDVLSDFSRPEQISPLFETAEWIESLWAHKNIESLVISICSTSLPRWTTWPCGVESSLNILGILHSIFHLVDTEQMFVD